MDESVFDIKIVFLWKHRNSRANEASTAVDPAKKINSALLLAKKTKRVRDHPRTDAREKKKDNLVIGKKIQPARRSTKSFYERRWKFRIFPPYVRSVCVVQNSSFIYLESLLRSGLENTTNPRQTVRSYYSETLWGEPCSCGW